MAPTTARAAQATVPPNQLMGGGSPGMEGRTDQVRRGECLLSLVSCAIRYVISGGMGRRGVRRCCCDPTACRSRMGYRHRKRRDADLWAHDENNDDGA